MKDPKSKEGKNPKHEKKKNEYGSINMPQKLKTSIQMSTPLHHQGR